MSRCLLFRRAVPLVSATYLLIGLAAAVTAPGATSSAPPASDVNSQASTGPDSDIVIASAAATAQGQRVEVRSREDAYSTTWANPDGTLTTDTSSSPVRVQRGGDWVDVDLSLRHVSGGWSPAASPVDVVFSDGADNDAVSLGSGSDQVNLSWAVKLPRPVIDGAVATYVLGNGQAVILTATLTGFEQSLVLDHAPATLPNLKLPFDTSQLSLTRGDRGGFEFTDSAGNVVYSMPTPFMYGDERDPITEQPVQTKAVSASLLQTVDGARLDLTPSMSWLTDPATVYPVTIDPVVAAVTIIGDAYVQDNLTTNVGTNEFLKVGMLGGHATRSYIRFGDMSTFAGATIQSAALKMYNNGANTCTPATINAYPILAWPSGVGVSNVVWSTHPTVNYSSAYRDTASFAHGIENSACPNAYDTIDIKTMVTAWANGVIPNNGVALNGTETTGSQGWVFCSRNAAASGSSCTYSSRIPTISITYMPPPPTAVAIASMCVEPNAGSCDSPAVTYSTSPTLTASTTSPAGLSLRYDFEVWSDENAAPSGVIMSGSDPGVASGTQSSWTPSAALGNNKSYQFRVRVFDSYSYSVWSPWLEFSTMAPAPHAVSAVVLDTRTSPTGPLTAHESRRLQVAGVAGLPTADLDGISAMFTAFAASGSTGQILAASEAGSSTVSAVSFNGATASSSAGVLVGADGSIIVTNAAAQSTQVEIRVVTWVNFYQPDTGVIDPNAPDTESDPLPEAQDAAPDTGPAPSDGEPVDSFTDPSDIADGTDAALVKTDLISSAGTQGDVDTVDTAGCADDMPDAGTSVATTCGTVAVPTDSEVAQFNSDMDSLEIVDSTSVASASSTDEITSAEQTTSASPSLLPGMPALRDHCPSRTHYYSRRHACTVNSYSYVVGQRDNQTHAIVRQDGTFTVWLEQTDQVQTKSLDELTVWTLHIQAATGICASPGYRFGINLYLSAQSGGPSINLKTIYYRTTSSNAGRIYYHVNWKQQAHVSAGVSANVHQTGIGMEVSPSGYPPVLLRHVGVHKRSDNLTYLGGVGTVLPYTIPTFRLDAGERNSKGWLRLLDAAEFVNDAEVNLVAHPGAYAYGGQPLRRTRNTTTIYNNRRTACPRSLKRAKGQSCDEYPFASTTQGAASGIRGYDWDRRIVPLSANSLVGTRLGQFLRANRIMDGDRYYVLVFNFPACGSRCI